MSNNYVNKKEKEESYEQNNAYTQSYEVPNNQLYQSREYYSQNFYQYSYPYNYYRGEGGMTMSKSEYLDETSSEKPKVKGKKKMVLEYIEPKNKRSVTFSKRKKGILKKAYELNVLTGAQVLLLIANDTGHVYTFATPKLRPIISDHEYLIQQCLNTPLIDDYNDFRHNKPLQTYPMDKTYEDFSGKRNEKE